MAISGTVSQPWVPWRRERRPMWPACGGNNWQRRGPGPDCLTGQAPRLRAAARQGRSFRVISARLRRAFPRKRLVQDFTSRLSAERAPARRQRGERPVTPRPGRTLAVSASQNRTFCARRVAQRHRCWPETESAIPSAFPCGGWLGLTGSSDMPLWAERLAVGGEPGEHRRQLGPAGFAQPGPAPGIPPPPSRPAASASGTRIRHASVTSSVSRWTSTSASRSSTSGQPS